MDIKPKVCGFDLDGEVTNSPLGRNGAGTFVCDVNDTEGGAGGGGAGGGGGGAGHGRTPDNRPLPVVMGTEANDSACCDWRLPDTVL